MALLALAVFGACTEADDTVVRDVGVVRVLFVDPTLTNPSFAPTTIQAVEWRVRRADLELASGRVVDLSGDGACRVADTFAILPATSGECSGVVIDSTEGETVAVTLDLELTMTAYRAFVPELPPFSDHDGDGVPNGEDNCPLLANPDQEDEDDDGTGDACTVDDPSLGESRDSDGDELPDVLDNCPAVPNPDQANTTGPAATGLPDGAGDACQQTAQVALDGDLQIRLELGPEELRLPEGGVRFVTVDFDGRMVLDCNWEFGVCSLDASAVEACVADSLGSAALGCSD